MAGSILRGLFLVGLVVAVCACATVDPWQDARLESEVKARLVAEKDANLTRLGVVSRQAVVYLTGDVSSAEQKAQAESVARNVGGVRRVVNAIEVRASQGAGRREASSGEAPPEDRARGVVPVR